MDLSLFGPYAVVQVANLLKHLVQQPQPRRCPANDVGGCEHIQMRQGRGSHDEYCYSVQYAAEAAGAQGPTARWRQAIAPVHTKRGLPLHQSPGQ